MELIQRAMLYLAKSSLSECELVELIQSWNKNGDIDDRVINEAINYLKQHSIVNDHRLANDLASKYSHKGNQYIYNLLVGRKFAKEATKCAIERIGSEYERAWKQAKLKVLTININLLSVSQLCNEISRFLRGRQFSLSTIESINLKLLKFTRHVYLENESELGNQVKTGHRHADLNQTRHSHLYRTRSEVA